MVGKTPADLSILVHEMVHHLQNVGQLKFNARKREKSVQSSINGSVYSGAISSRIFSWTILILVKTKCFYRWLHQLPVIRM